MAEPVLDTRTLNRALLARQLLLARSKLSIPRAVERIGGLQTQYAPSAYIGLWSRLHGFQRPQLTGALEKARVIQATLMRVTIHIVSAADYPLLTEAVRRSRQEWWSRVAGPGRLDDAGYAKVAALIREALADGPRPRKELVQVLVDNGFAKETWEGVGLWVDMVRVPPSGTWERRRADLYGLANHWVPMTAVSEHDALEHLVKRYLGGFGPATVGDISSWAGVPVNTLRPVIERMRLRTFRGTDDSQLIDLPRQPIPAPETIAPVRFLPTWDATLLIHARRTQILPEEYRKQIFSIKNPQSLSPFLVNGAVAGTWKQAGAKVDLEPFAPLPRIARRELDEEASRLARFLG
ncbi:MAG: winged helix DNA-binding domain-containing protein [Acidimicrobiia bacterium]